MAYNQAMQEAKMPETRQSGLRQKVTGTLDWEHYLRLIEHCKRTKQPQMGFVARAVKEKLDREEAKEATA